MGSSPSRSVIKSQAPAKCGICKLEQPIKWKCINCGNLMCNHCKHYVHPKIKHANEHMVLNIKNLGQLSVINLTIDKRYATELDVVRHMSYFDDSLWISGLNKKVFQRVKPEGNKLTVLQRVNIKVFGMTATQSNNILIAHGEQKLKQIISKTGQLTDSVYNMSTLHAIALHTISDNKVLVGCFSDDFPKQGSGVVILMNHNGDHERVYEHDQHKQPIFTLPRSITSTSNGNIHVVDQVSAHGGRVVVLGQGGDIINIYTGHSEINKDKRLSAMSIVTTPRDNVIGADGTTHTLHILNNAGRLMSYIDTSIMDILCPTSLAFNPTGQLYIGYSHIDKNTTQQGYICEVTTSGC